MCVHAGCVFPTDDIGQPFKIVRAKATPEICDRAPAYLPAIMNSKTRVHEQRSHSRIFREERDAMICIRHFRSRKDGNERNFCAPNASGYDEANNLWTQSEIDQCSLAMRWSQRPHRAFNDALRYSLCSPGRISSIL